MVFRAFGAAGEIRFEGDWHVGVIPEWPFWGWTNAAHDDEIHAIYVAGTPATVRFITKDENTPAHEVDTGLTLGVAPLAPLPIEISIYGNEGKDKVDVWLGGPAGAAGLGGFPVGSVSKFRFWGHQGDDTLVPPEGPAGAGQGNRILTCCGEDT
jgi:hypothetical protein